MPPYYLLPGTPVLPLSCCGTAAQTAHTGLTALTRGVAERAVTERAVTVRGEEEKTLRRDLLSCHNVEKTRLPGPLTAVNDRTWRRGRDSAQRY